MLTSRTLTLSLILHLGAAAALYAQTSTLVWEYLARPVPRRMQDATVNWKWRRVNRHTLAPDQIHTSQSAATASGWPSAAPVSEGTPSDELDAYLTEVRALIQEAVQYPSWLQRQGVLGRTRLKIAVNENGVLDQVTVIEPSGSDDLDELALAAARAASPFRPFSGEFSHLRKLSLSLWIEFH